MLNIILLGAFERGWKGLYSADSRKMLFAFLRKFFSFSRVSFPWTLLGGTLSSAQHQNNNTESPTRKSQDPTRRSTAVSLFSLILRWFRASDIAHVLELTDLLTFLKAYWSIHIHHESVLENDKTKSERVNYDTKRTAVKHNNNSTICTLQIRLGNLVVGKKNME